MILELPTAGNSDLAILETIDTVIPVACGKFPVVAGREFSHRGQGTFLARAAIFFGKVGNSVAGRYP
jgi:hypothetical protein